MNETLPLHQLENTPLHFLVCVDSKSESLTALRMACVKARKRSGYVYILHVVEKTEGESLFGVAEKIRKEKIDEAQKLLNKLAIVAEGITGHKPNIFLREGSIGDTIINVCTNEVAVNLIVLGVAVGATRGKLISWLASQLGEKMIMPILLVPGNLTDQQLIEIS